MKHKTWFRLVIKAIGVLLVGISLSNIGTVIGMLADALLSFAEVDFYFAGGRSLQDDWAWYSGDAAQFAFGLYLFFGGKWVVNRCIPSNRPYCPDCGYDLSHASAATERCPECGVLLPRRDAAATAS